MNDQRGMTMVELMVSLAIVMLIIAIASVAYIKLVLSYKSHSSISASYMSNLTGLELLRYDIGMAGFGLPENTSQLTNGYPEAAAQSDDTPEPPYNPAALNESNANIVSNPPAPHPFLLQTGNATGAQTPAGNYAEVLAIKSTLANISDTSKRWSTITEDANGTASNPQVKSWGGTTALNPVMDFTSGPPVDNFIMLDNNGNLQITAGNGAAECAPGETWCYTFDTSSPTQGYYNNASAITTTGAPVYYIYGLDNSTTNTTGVHVMPFNRVDYYLGKTSNTSCAPNTWTLYRGVVQQANGTLSSSVLIDCVEDFEVAFGVASPGNNNNIVWQPDLGQENIGGSQSSLMTPSMMQQNLREVRVYIVYQEGTGKISSSPLFKFSSSSPFSLGSDLVALGPPYGLANLLNGTGWTPSGQDIYYHWKLAELDVKPINLVGLSSTTGR